MNESAVIDCLFLMLAVRFLKRNQKTGNWDDLGDEVGKEKVSENR